MLRSALLGFLLVLLPLSGFASDKWEPWAKPQVESHAHDAVPSSQTWLFLWAVKFYQIFISPADGAGCTYYPTCSGYSAQALRKHGALTGFIMTAERTNRNHSNQDGYFPQVSRWGRVYIWDPVENNDFWFGDSKRQGPNVFAHPTLHTEIFWDRY